MRKYKPRSMAGAIGRIETMERLCRERERLLEQYRKERHALAKLAAEGPAFDNPLHVIEAKKIRDAILYSELILNPDGTRVF